MKKINNKKGFTLVELLAVIVVLAIVMGLAVVGITTVLENTRKSAFAADAKSFIQGARNLVQSDMANSLLGENTKYAPKCTSATETGTETVYIPLSAIILDQGGEKSPYGNPYYKSTDNKDPSKAENGYTVFKYAEKQASYISVRSTFDSTTGNCTYTYSIYLTDGVFSIKPSADDAGKAVSESSISAAMVFTGA